MGRVTKEAYAKQWSAVEQTLLDIHDQLVALLDPMLDVIEREGGERAGNEHYFAGMVIAADSALEVASEFARLVINGAGRDVMDKKAPAAGKGARKGHGKKRGRSA